MMTTHSRGTHLALFLAVAAVGCERSQAAATAPASTAQVAQASAAAPAEGKLARIAFVGKQDACDCTRKSIDAGWAALQGALGTPNKLPVELLQVDTEAAKVEAYRVQKPILTLPGIYFLDAQGVVLEMLQGEVTAEQITAVMKRL